MIVEVPNVGKIEFPDDTPKEVVESAIANFLKSRKPEKPSLPLLEEAKNRKVSVVSEGKDYLSELMRQIGLSVRAPITGVSQLAGIVGDPAAQLMNMIAGRQIATPPTQTVEQLLQRSGLPTPETSQERLAQDLAGALTGTGGVMRLGTQLAKGALSPVTRGVGEALAAAPEVQAAAAAGGALAGGVAREEGVGPMGQIGAALIGSVAPGIPVAARAPAQAAKAVVQPFTEEGQQVIAGNILRRFATVPDEAAARLESAPTYVPGSTPTMAEAARDPGLLALQGPIGKIFDPQNLIGQRVAQQNLARVQAMEEIAGTPATIEAAKAARTAATAPARVESFLAQKEFGPMSYDATNPIKSQIAGIVRGETGAQEPVEVAMNWLAGRLKTIESKAQVTPERLYGLRKDINRAIEGKFDSVNPALRLASGELAQVRQTLDEVIEASAPGFKQYLAEYAERSRPISQMQLLQDVALKSRVAAPDITLGEAAVPIFSQAKLRQEVTKRAADLKRTLTSEQAQKLDNILADLDRSAGLTSTVARRVGSDTFKNFSVANLIGSMFSDVLADTATVRSLSAPLNILYKIPDEKVSQLLVEAVLDPQFASMLMKQASKKTVEPVAKALAKKAQEIGVSPIATTMPRE